MTKDAKVTGIPPWLSLSDAGGGEIVSFEAALGAEVGLSDAELPRRSRMTNPSSLSPAIVQFSQTSDVEAYHRPRGLASREGRVEAVLERGIMAPSTRHSGQGCQNDFRN